jgi:carboxylesterase
LGLDAGAIPGSGSFVLRPRGRIRARVLLLHGFSASPYEVRELGSYLAGRGHLVFAPRMAGHGAGRAEFDASGRKEWIDGARKAFASFRQPGTKTVIIGHSAGGLLAALLARQHPSEVAGLVLGAPAFRLCDATAPLSLIPLVRLFKPSLHFHSPHPDALHWTQDYATRCVAELVRMGREAAKAAESLEMPVLMLQASGDDIVSLPFNEALFNRIPSPHKRLIVYGAGEHNVFHHYNPVQGQVLRWAEAGVREFTG